MGFRIEHWRLQSLALPVVWRHCAYCGELRAFVCSERFRVNAQKKVLDVWLLYRCSSCTGVWKYPVLSRYRVAQIDPTLRLAFECNDAITVQRYACDVARLRLHATQIELSERLQITRRVEDLNGASLGDVICITVLAPCALRLERLLAQELQLSRGELERRRTSGALLLQPDHANALRRPVRDGQRVCFVGGLAAAV